MSLTFEVSHRSRTGQSRCACFTTAHGEVATPAFMPVGTYGAVRGMSVETLEAAGAEIILANAYHLYLRPGPKFLRDYGGLHRFMGWSRPILTDSGGYQLFSQPELTKIHEEGVEFRSHIDGSKHLLTPEALVKVQAAIGSDIAMPLDCLVPATAAPSQLKEAVARTLRWLKRTEAAKRTTGLDMFAIIQGGVDLELRRRAVTEALTMDFSGVALGGFSVGEKKEPMWEAVEACVAELPAAKPRYLMGLGLPEDLVEAVDRGLDLFDCVLPTRNGRNAMLFTSQGNLNVRNAAFTDDDAPPDPACGCFVCKRYARAYIRYLFKTGEPLGFILTTFHNVFYYLHLMKEMRIAIAAGRFTEWKRSFFAKRSLNDESMESAVNPG